MSATIDLAQIRSAVQGVGAPWQAGETSLSRLPEFERKRRLGVRPPPQAASPEQIDQRVRARPPLAGTVVTRNAGAPASYDLRDVQGESFITGVKDQQACGSCVAFGVVAAIEGTLLVQRGSATAVDLSEAHLFYCLGGAQGVTCASGWWPEQALDACAQTGVVDEACFPYVPVDQDCSNRCADWQSRVTKITRHTALATPAAMKDWIGTRGPLAACLLVYDDFFTYTSGIYRRVTGEMVGGHCVAIVGYDDIAGYWICKNSWGTAWGERGYFRIGYGECGIDSWLVSAIDGVEETGWLRDRRVIGFWSNDQERNAWVYVDGGIGWRRVAFDSDAVHVRLLAVLIAARAAGRPVSLLQTQGVITQVYLL